MSHHIMIALSVSYSAEKTDGPSPADIRDAITSTLESMYPDDTVGLTVNLATQPVYPAMPVPMPDPESGIIVGTPPDGVGWA